MEDRYETGDWSLRDVTVTGVDTWEGWLYLREQKVGYVVQDLDVPDTGVRWYWEAAKEILVDMLLSMAPIEYEGQEVPVDLDIFMARLYDAWTSGGD